MRNEIGRERCALRRTSRVLRTDWDSMVASSKLFNPLRLAVDLQVR